ncbi:MAG TPA: hypothetical protein VNB64_07640 [Solirubrobacteraceae bacterium]|nr:hypothetical protein [Solirubrobacteraceae bacterium]
MRKVLLILLLATSASAVTAPAAHAQTDDPGAIAAALRSDPVHADPRARPTLSPAEAGRVRLAILEHDIGRIKIAIVRPQAAASAGGVKGLADAIDQQLRAAGTLLVIAGENAWVTTSYDRPQAAVVAVRRAFAGDAPLADQLVRAVEGIARIDPGPSGDLERTVPVVSPEIDDAAEGFLNTIKLIFWVVGAVIALPFLVGALLIVRAVWRSVRASKESVGDERSDVEDSLVQLGERIRELDAQAGIFENDSVGQSAYEGALDAYERAGRLLPDADSARRVARVKAAIAEGQRHVTTAKDRVDAATGAPTTPAATPDAQREAANQAFGRE